MAAAALSKREAHFRPTSYKLSIYLYVNSALCSFSRKCSVTLSYQLAVFSSDLTSVLSMASRARLLKQPWPTVLRWRTVRTVCNAEALHCPTPCL